MPIYSLEVDLSLPPEERWQIPGRLLLPAQSLLEFYLQDLGDLSDISDLLMEQAPAFIPEAYLMELQGFTTRYKIPYQNLLTTNLYFDLLKFVLGCSAFAIQTPEGPLHARNLDWWSENQALKNLSTETYFKNGPQGEFYSFGWPGFTGILSGMAPGRFAITVNAVLSDDPARPAKPLVYLLREIFEQASSYHEARDRLLTEEIASDALLLITGIENNQACVIERTPTHAAVREMSENWIAVTNSYQLIDADQPHINELQASSCGRYQHMEAILSHTPPRDRQACLTLLNAPQVKMNMTMQNMVFQASKGSYDFRMPTE